MTSKLADEKTGKQKGTQTSAFFHGLNTMECRQKRRSADYVEIGLIEATASSFRTPNDLMMQSQI